MKINQDEYYIWLLDLVNNEEDQCSFYGKLLRKLYREQFYWSVPCDDNRAADGIALRQRFIEEVVPFDTNCTDGRPCSVLEMMVALACRIEDDIMYDPDMGDRTHVWFWAMIFNLGLDTFDDDYFDEGSIDEILHIFLKREYGRGGYGSLFPLRNSTKNMRKTEIWYQMNYWINENYE